MSAKGRQAARTSSAHAELKSEVEGDAAKASTDVGGGRTGGAHRLPGLLPLGRRPAWPVGGEPRKRTSPSSRSETYPVQFRPADFRSAPAVHSRVGDSL